MEDQEGPYQIQIEGAGSVASSVRLKELLLDGFASKRSLELDLEAIEETDSTLLQLLWAAAREADRTDAGFVVRVSDTVMTAVSEAGFEPLLALHLWNKPCPK